MAMTLRLEQSENPRLEARVSKGGLIAPVRTTRFTGGTDCLNDPEKAKWFSNFDKKILNYQIFRKWLQYVSQIDNIALHHNV